MLDDPPDELDLDAEPPPDPEPDVELLPHPATASAAQARASVVTTVIRCIQTGDAATPGTFPRPFAAPADHAARLLRPAKFSVWL